MIETAAAAARLKQYFFQEHDALTTLSVCGRKGVAVRWKIFYFLLYSFHDNNDSDDNDDDQVRQWQHWGSGCYNFTCQEQRLHMQVMQMGSMELFLSFDIKAALRCDLLKLSPLIINLKVLNHTFTCFYPGQEIEVTISSLKVNKNCQEKHKIFQDSFCYFLFYSWIFSVNIRGTTNISSLYLAL